MGDLRRVASVGLAVVRYSRPILLLSDEGSVPAESSSRFHGEEIPLLCSAVNIVVDWLDMLFGHDNSLPF